MLPAASAMRHVMVVRINSRRRHRIARRMVMLGWPRHAIATTLRVKRARLDSILSGNDIWDTSHIEFMRAAMVDSLEVA